MSSRKILTLAIGQCGNQVTSTYWSRIRLEHGIDAEGVLQHPDNSLDDRKDIFFYEADDGRYVPRSIFIDLEPGVLLSVRQECPKLYNPENFLLLEQSGAGNKWSVGYDFGVQHYETISEAIRREAEVADSLEGFIMCHSIAGGTGSGISSCLLEKLSDDYKKSTFMNYAVFPESKTNKEGIDETAIDVVVEPYNSVLSLSRLIQYSDAVVILDNASLFSIAAKISENKTTINNNDVNSLISTVMSATTATLRFPSYSNNDMISLLAPLIPTPQCHFLMTGYTPLSFDTSSKVVCKTSVIDVIRRLLNKKNIMVTADVEKGMYISILNIIQGEVDPSEIHTALRQVRDTNSLRFIPWGPASLQLALSRSSSFVKSQHRVSGLMLANHTSIRYIFKGIVERAKKISKARAFMTGKNSISDTEVFEHNPDKCAEEINKCIGIAQDLVKEYEDAEKADFLTLGM